MEEFRDRFPVMYCQNPECSFSFTNDPNEVVPQMCPKCGGSNFSNVQVHALNQPKGGMTNDGFSAVNKIRDLFFNS